MPLSTGSGEAVAEGHPPQAWQAATPAGAGLASVVFADSPL